MDSSIEDRWNHLQGETGGVASVDNWRGKYS